MPKESGLQEGNVLCLVRGKLSQHAKERARSGLLLKVDISNRQRHIISNNINIRWRISLREPPPTNNNNNNAFWVSRLPRPATVPQVTPTVRFHPEIPGDSVPALLPRHPFQSL